MKLTTNQILGGLALAAGAVVLYLFGSSKDGSSSGGTSPGGKFSSNPARQRVADIALSQVGKGGNGSYMPLYLVPGDTVEEGWKPGGNGDPIQQPPTGGHVQWCGIFTLWVLHRAGIIPNVKWIWGKGYAARFPTTNNPKTGDIGYMNAWNHHDIILEAKGDLLHTVDGNDGGSPGGMVKENWIPRSKFAMFFSIAKEVGE